MRLSYSGNSILHPTSLYAPHKKRETAALAAASLILHRLTDDVPDSIGGVTFHLRRGVGVGTEREARVVVSQCTGQRLDIHAVFKGQRGEGVSEVMEAYVFRADCF